MVSRCFTWFPNWLV